MPIIVAFGLAYLLCIRMDAMVNLRGLYAQGRRQLRKMGLKLPYDADDVAWWVLLLSKASVGMAVAIISGTLSAQVLFRPELLAELASHVASQNASILAFHTKAVDAEVKVARDTRDRDAKELAELIAQQGTLLKRETQLSGSVGRTIARQQPVLSAAREANSSTLGKIDTRVAAAEAKASASDQAYKRLEAGRNRESITRTETDPHFTKPPWGVLSNLTSLKNVAARDNVVAAGVGIVDFVGLALEAWILILTLASPPTKLAVNLYRDVLRHSVEAARSLADDLKGDDDDDDPTPTGGAGISPKNAGGAAFAPTPIPDELLPPLPRRGRGRPRKHPIPSTIPQ